MDAEAKPTAGALAHVRVLELGSGIAAPYASRLLADLGADVVKVEISPGDPLRKEAPLVTATDGEEVGALFVHLNANKRLVCIGEEALRSSLLELVAGVDILIEDLGAGTLERLGLAPDTLRAANPALVVARLSAFGQMFAEDPPNGFLLQAIAGWIEAREGVPTPAQVGGRLHEYIAGGWVAAAALTALLTARRIGRGVDADVSLLECAHGALCFPTLTASVLAQLGRGTSRATLLGTKPCRDGWVGINVVNSEQWRRLCRLVGADEFVELREELRQGGADRQTFEDRVAAWTSERGIIEVVEALQALRVPAVPLHDGASIRTDPHWQARPFFARDASHDAAFEHPGFPWRLSRTPARITRPCSARGSASASLDGLGWDRRRSPIDVDVSGGLPLEGVRVVSLGTYWAGASLASYLGAMGADVIKVEAIQRPDGWRYNMVAPSLGPQWYERGRYRGTNLNQRGLTLNLDSRRGREILEGLLRTADVLLENFAASVIGRLGFDWEHVSKVNPRLVMVRMPGFGVDGPRRDQVGFGPSFAQFAGHSTLTGFADLPPQTAGGFLDPTVGVHAALVTMAALEHRRLFGMGQLVEVPQIEVGVCVAPEPVIRNSLTGEIMLRTGNRAANAAPQGVYCAADGRWIALSVTDDEGWRNLVKALGEPAWAAHLDTLEARKAAHDQLDRRLATWIAGDTAASKLQIFQAADVPCALVEQAEDFLTNRYLAGRGYFEVVDHSVVGPDTYPGWPVRFSRGPTRSHRAPCPLLGEHNEEILRSLGLSDVEIEALEREAIIGTAPIDA
ncbi:MAG: CoA transferase [Phenylobacterium sp.]|uniref:CaiB/BaiF CoA-transferase family protein n=1 Tax=Phenylobacterium sp. TaxID=1871053 RepID=UPI001A1B30B8|nr:CoA transferase [Phenylobacterium sp.]MBJ7412060.1 CoA transferase [Phenylobacterium sp.]